MTESAILVGTYYSLRCNLFTVIYMVQSFYSQFAFPKKKNNIFCVFVFFSLEKVTFDINWLLRRNIVGGSIDKNEDILDIVECNKQFVDSGKNCFKIQQLS